MLDTVPTKIAKIVYLSLVPTLLSGNGYNLLDQIYECSLYAFPLRRVGTSDKLTTNANVDYEKSLMKKRNVSVFGLTAEVNPER